MNTENPPLRILVAEDESIIRLDIKETLVAQGYEVVAEATNGKEALQMILELEPNVVILDIKMPEMDGISVAKAVSDICGVVILSAFSQQEQVKKAIEAGTQVYLVKPFEQNELRAAIELAAVRFKESKALLAETQELTERLQTRKTIDKAKGILMDEYKYKEPSAFAFIQKSAMNSRTTMKAVAEKIISGSLKP